MKGRLLARSEEIAYSCEELTSTPKMSSSKQQSEIQSNGETCTIRDDSNTKVPNAAADTESVRMALKRAREKLHGAMQKRERALKRMRPSDVVIAPITALSADLVIQNISETGPPEHVYFPFATRSVDLCHAQTQSQGPSSKIQNLPTQKDTSQALFERKLRLQRELQLLKEKLELCQQDSDSAFDPNDNPKKINQSQYNDDQGREKEDCGQTIIDLSHWKHFVSKQASLLDDTTKRLTETKQALIGCETEQQEAESQLQAIHQVLLDLEMREKAVITLLKGATCKLLRTRMDLQLQQQRQQVNVSNVTELDI